MLNPAYNNTPSPVEGSSSAIFPCLTPCVFQGRPSTTAQLNSLQDGTAVASNVSLTSITPYHGVAHCVDASTTDTAVQKQNSMFPSPLTSPSGTSSEAAVAKDEFATEDLQSGQVGRPSQVVPCNMLAAQKNAGDIPSDRQRQHADPGLSAQGHEDAIKCAHFLETAFLSRPTSVVSTAQSMPAGQQTAPQGLATAPPLHLMSPEVLGFSEVQMQANTCGSCSQEPGPPQACCGMPQEYPTQADSDPSPGHSPSTPERAALQNMHSKTPLSLHRGQGTHAAGCSVAEPPKRVATPAP